MKMELLGSDIIFQFVDDVVDGTIQSQLSNGIIIAGKQMDQQRTARWGRVIGIGPKVSADIKIGEYILIEPLMWSVGFVFDSTTKYWRTEESKVLAVSETAITE